MTMWRSLAFVSVFCALTTTQLYADAFNSAVITLVFPPGARATGLGEAFTALANDANATFFNPAGLGQPPLSHSWNSHLGNRNTPFVAIAARRRKDFSLREKIWAGTAQGVLRYNGKAWESEDRHLIEQDENLESIVRKYLKTDDENAVARAIRIVRKENGIEMKRYNAIKAVLATGLLDSAQGRAETIADSLSWVILNLPRSDRTASEISPLIRAFSDSVRAEALSGQIEKAFAAEDVELSGMVELRVPFTIAFSDSVTALTVDGSDKVWVGTRNGLWRFDGEAWSLITVLDGLPSNVVTALAVGKNDEIAVGTERGFALLVDGNWESDDLSDAKVPDTRVSTISIESKSNVYAGTAFGLIQKSGKNYTLYDTTQGLLSNRVSALMLDSEGKLWVGGDNGVALYTGASWKRYRFPGSVVYSFAEYGPGKVWIGTNRGALSYKAGRKKIDDNGKMVEQPPEWKPFHSKNALDGEQVLGIAVHGNDVWLSTEKAINQYNVAERQGLIFWELLLPELRMPDLWHTYAALIIPTEDWGTFGLTINYLNFGLNELQNEEGVVTNTFQSWEGVFGLTYGLMLKQDLSAGLSIKYVQSALAPGIGKGSEGTGRTFAIDFGVLKRNLFTRGFDLGFCLQNMGPPIYYIDQKEKDPIPFTAKLGFAYRAVESPIIDLTLLADFNREIAKNYVTGSPDPFWKAIYTDLFKRDSSNQTLYQKARVEAEEIIVNLGAELWYVNFLAARTGFLFDYVGERYELTLGLGIRYGNLDFDFSYIHSPPGFFKSVMRTVDKESEGSHGIRDGQPRFSLIVKF